MNNMIQNNQTNDIQQKNDFVQRINDWRNVPGDIDDFIFFDQDFCESER